MANLIIGDKIQSSVSSRTSGSPENKAANRHKAGSGEDPAQQGDSVELSDGGPQKLERPLSDKLRNSNQAQETLQRLKAQFQEQPAIAVASHGNLSHTQAYVLLKS